MQIFPNIPKEDLGTTFTHYGWFCGIVPIYIGGTEYEPILSARNWCPEFFFDAVEVIATLCLSMKEGHDDYGYPIKITGEIKSND